MKSLDPRALNAALEDFLAAIIPEPSTTATYIVAHDESGVQRTYLKGQEPGPVEIDGKLYWQKGTPL